MEYFLTLDEVWDGLTGTQLQSLTTHEADVLCLCVTEGQTGIFASGCDGKVSTDCSNDGSGVDTTSKLVVTPHVIVTIVLRI